MLKYRYYYFYGNWTRSLIMEVLEDKLVFSRGDGFKWRCKLYLVNFKKLLSIPNEKQADICEVIKTPSS